MEARNRFIIARDNVLFAENTFLKEKTKVENVNSQISWISKRPDFVKRLLRFCETSDQGKHRGRRSVITPKFYPVIRISKLL